jgi:hypothetical protein
MTKSKPPDVAALLAPLRAKEAALKAEKQAKQIKQPGGTRKKQGGGPFPADTNHSREALMTLVAIMKDPENPRLQMAAAKTLLDRGFKAALADASEIEANPPSQDDIDAAIALAKAVLDALAAGKSRGVEGQGAMAAERAPETDHAGG